MGHVLCHDSLLGDNIEGRMSSKRPSRRPRQKTLDRMIKKMEKLGLRKNGRSGVQNLPLGREPKLTFGLTVIR